MTATRRALLDMLSRQPGLCQSDLASRLGVSERTVRRHLKSLCLSGTAVVTADGRERRYRLADGAHEVAPAPPLTEHEVEALGVAALAARPLLAPTPLAAPLDAAALKLQQAWLADVVTFEPETDAAHWSFDGAAGAVSTAGDAPVFRTLLDAARGGHAVRADYFTASRQSLGHGRTLGPLGLLVRGGAWLVACRDLDADDAPVKDFALAGFRTAEPLDQPFKAPDDWSLDHYTRDRFGALDGEVETVRLLIEAEAVPYFQRKLYNPTQQTEETYPDGRAVVSFEASGLDAVKAWALSWGGKVRVLAPVALADAVAQAHRQAAARYEP